MYILILFMKIIKKLFYLFTRFSILLAITKKFCYNYRRFKIIAYLLIVISFKRWKGKCVYANYYFEKRQRMFIGISILTPSRRILPCRILNYSDYSDRDRLERFLSLYVLDAMSRRRRRSRIQSRIDLRWRMRSQGEIVFESSTK